MNLSLVRKISAFLLLGEDVSFEINNNDTIFIPPSKTRLNASSGTPWIFRA